MKKNMKTEVKSTVAVATPELKTEVILPIAQVAQMVAQSASSGQVLPKEVTAASLGEYISHQIAIVEGGTRQIVLTFDAAARTSEKLFDLVKVDLKGRGYANSTILGLAATGRDVVPVLRRENLLGFGDIAGLKEVAKYIKPVAKDALPEDKELHQKAHRAVIDGIKAARGVRAIVTGMKKDGIIPDGSGNRAPKGSVKPAVNIAETTKATLNRIMADLDEARKHDMQGTAATIRAFIHQHGGQNVFFPLKK